MGLDDDRDEWQRMIREDLKELIDLVEASGIDELEVVDGDREVRIRVDKTIRPQDNLQGDMSAQGAEQKVAPVVVLADRVGTFYRSQDRGASHLKSDGDEAYLNETIAYLDSLKVLHEVKAPVPGHIVQFLVEDGCEVEYGEQLATIASQRLDGEP